MRQGSLKLAPVVISARPQRPVRRGSIELKVAALLCLAAAVLFALLPFSRGPAWDHVVGALAALTGTALAAASAVAFRRPNLRLLLALAAVPAFLLAFAVAFVVTSAALGPGGSPPPPVLATPRAALPSTAARPTPTRAPSPSPRPTPAATPVAISPSPAAIPVQVASPSPPEPSASPAPSPPVPEPAPTPIQPPTAPLVPDSATLYGVPVFSATAVQLAGGEELDYGGPGGRRFAADLELAGGSAAGFQVRWLVGGEEIDVDPAAGTVRFGSSFIELAAGGGPISLLVVADGDRLTLWSAGLVIGQLAARPGSPPPPRLMAGAGAGSVGVLGARVYTLGSGDG